MALIVCATIVLMERAVIEEVKRLVKESGESLQSIAEGSGVGATWLRNLVHDQRGDYGVRKVSRVRDYLLAKRTEQQRAA